MARCEIDPADMETIGAREFMSGESEELPNPHLPTSPKLKIAGGIALLVAGFVAFLSLDLVCSPLGEMINLLERHSPIRVTLEGLLLVLSLGCTFFGCQLALFRHKYRHKVALGLVVTVALTGSLELLQGNLGNRRSSQTNKPPLAEATRCRPILVLELFHIFQPFLPDTLEAWRELAPDSCRAIQLHSFFESFDKARCPDGARDSEKACYLAILDDLRRSEPLKVTGQLMYLAVGVQIAIKDKKTGLSNHEAVEELVEILEGHMLVAQERIKGRLQSLESEPQANQELHGKPLVELIMDTTDWRFVSSFSSKLNAIIAQERKEITKDRKLASTQASHYRERLDRCEKTLAHLKTDNATFAKFLKDKIARVDLDSLDGNNFKDVLCSEKSSGADCI